MVRALAGPTRFRTLALIVLAAGLADGLVFAQTGGCARCGGWQPTARLELPFDSLPRIAPEAAPRREIRKELPRRKEVSGGGTYTVCVRTCDGGFFPVTYFGARSRADTLQEVCQAQCPNAEVKLYSLPTGGTIDEAVSSTGEPYSLLPNAHKFEQSYDSSCSCRRAGQSWAEALAAAEARYGHNRRDIMVTAEKSAEMSRPIEPKRVASRALSVKTDAVATDDGSPAPSLELDVNGVDTKLSAAAAAISRVSSGIRDESAKSRPTYGRKQGRTVEEKGPDGRPRRVRIVGPSF